jgi:superfamily II DNA helicase RecQ
VPSYVICNNRQLVEIVQTQPKTLAALSTINGIGKAKIEKYGQALLDQLDTPLEKISHEKN